MCPLLLHEPAAHEKSSKGEGGGHYCSANNLDQIFSFAVPVQMLCADVLHPTGVCSHPRSQNLLGQNLPEQMSLFQWSFSADMLAVDPDDSYNVSVYNIPRPEVHHSHYDVSAEVTAPGEVLVVEPFSVRSV